MTGIPFCTRGERPMRKTVLIILGGCLWTLALVASASGQWLDKGRDWVERDAQGRRTGTVEPSGRGGYVERDARGRRQETGEAGPGGPTIRRDAQGCRTGTVEPGSGG